MASQHVEGKVQMIDIIGMRTTLGADLFHQIQWVKVLVTKPPNRVNPQNSHDEQVTNG